MKNITLIYVFLSVFLFAVHSANAQTNSGEVRAALWDSLSAKGTTWAEFKELHPLKNESQQKANQALAADFLFQKSTPEKQNILAETNPQARFVLAEDCTNGLDDDGDGFVDCYDTDCQCFSGDDCSVDVLPNVFRTTLDWMSDEPGPSVTATPMVGNLNPQDDDIPEIIIPIGRSGGFNDVPNKILFFKGDGTNKGAPNIQNIPGGFDGYPGTNHTIGDLNGDGVPELVVACRDRALRVYTNYRDIPVNPMVLWMTSTPFLEFGDGRPYLADFDGDGVSEIYVGNQIIKINNLASGNPVLSLILDSPQAFMARAPYFDYNEGSCSPTAADLLTPADCNGDPDCNGLELVAGPIIFSVDTRLDDGDGYQLKIQRSLNIMQTNSTFKDGYTAVADMDLDGVLDVVVAGARNSTYGVYVWNKFGVLGFMRYADQIPRHGSLACIANIFDDRTEGFPRDLPEIIVCNAYSLNCVNLNKSSLNPAEPFWWTLQTNDYSGFTGSTFFDFNGDGFSELVYRDEDHIRILYGGAAPYPPGVDAERNWYKFPCGSITSDEYPIVADVDSDGEAEIVVTGYEFAGYNTPSSDYRGRIQVYKSDAEPWLPCRDVWNQFNYFIVNVNDDLSIPAQQQAHHVEFPAAGSGNWPFNMYLSQRPVLDEEFEPFLPVPDAVASVVNVECASPGMIMASVRVCNEGSNRLKTNVPIAFYATDPTTTNATQHGDLFYLPSDIEPDACETLQILLPAPPNGGTIFGVVNDNGSLPRPFNLAADFPVTFQPECIFPNNIFSLSFAFSIPPLQPGPDVSICPNQSVQIGVSSTHLSYIWENGQTTQNISVNQPGVYRFQVEDVCNTWRMDSIEVLGLQPAPIFLSPINTCPGNTVNLSLPSDFQQVIWSQNGNILCTGCSSFDFSPNTNSTNIRVQAQSNGCPTESIVMVGLHPIPDVQLQAQNGTCQNGSGLATAFVANGTPQPYTFLWANGSTNPALTINQTGDYAVTITDGNGCSSTNSVFVETGSALVVESDFEAIPCAGGHTDLVVTPVTGLAPYSFLWENGQTTAVLSQVNAGTYRVTTTDAQGCLHEMELAVTEPPALIAQVISENPRCYGQLNGSISLQAQGGTAPYQFTWFDGFIGENRDNLSAGLYAAILTDAEGCSYPISKTLEEPTPIEALDATTEPSCPNAENGALVFEGVQGGEAPYAYQWSSGDTDLNLTGLSAGDYVVTATDAQGCSVEKAFQVNSIPEVLYEAAITHVACFGENSGAIELNLISGGADALFSWTNGISTANNPALSAGNYDVTLTFGGGKCYLSNQYLVLEPPSLQSNTFPTPIACFGENTGTIAAQVQGGTPPYAYWWSNDATDSLLTFLQAGNYALTVTDAKGCTLENTASIAEPTPLELLDANQNPACPNASDGALIWLGAQQGTPPYNFVWSNGANGTTLPNLAAGLYSVTATDQNGCSASREFEVMAIEPYVFDAETMDVACHGDASGAIQLVQQSGPNDPTFVWSNGLFSQNINNLPAGDYQVTVQYAGNKCQVAADFTINEPQVLELNLFGENLVCPNDNSGAITSQPSGGTLPYVFSWKNGATTPNQSNLPAGIYQITLTDAHQCTDVQEITLTEPPVMLLSDAISVPTCPNTTNGSLALTLGASLGVPPYTYLWSNGQTILNINNLAFGNYTLVATDARGCTVERSYEVPILDAIVLDTVVKPITCFGAADGQILVNWIGGAPDAQFSWSNGVSTLSNPQLGPGTYLLEANYGNGCAQSWPFQLVEPDALNLQQVVKNNIACAGDATGTLTAEVLGGTPPIQISWSNGQNSANITALRAGIYFLTATDARGCALQATAELTEPNPLTLELMATADTCEQATGSLLGVYAGGTAGYQFLWQNGATTDNLNQLSPGVYALTLTDANGCSLSKSAQVLEYGRIPQLDLNDAHLNCYVPNAELRAITDQNGLTYIWETPLTGAVGNVAALTTAQGGIFRLQVRNAFGCTAETTAEVTVDTLHPQVWFLVDTLAMPCGGDSIGLLVNTSLLEPDFQRGWAYFAPNSLNPQVLNNVNPVLTVTDMGLYRFSVLDPENGCRAMDSIWVEKPVPMQVSYQTKPVSCFGEGDGLAQVNVLSGGLPPYRYALDGNPWTALQNFPFLEPGLHRIAVEDASDCAWSVEFEITEPDSFYVDLNISDTVVYYGQLVSLNVQFPAGAAPLRDIYWLPLPQSFDPFALNQVHLPEEDMSYTLRLVDKNGCVAIDRVDVDVLRLDIYAPNIIKPEDGQNRAFTLFTGEDVTRILTLRIYDRWGNMVFENTDFQPNQLDLGWNGDFQGRPMNPAVFVWVAEVELADGQELLLKGDVTVVR